MARPLRIQYPGALYHITSRGNARRPIFKDQQDRTLFLDTMKKVKDRHHWICHAYCLMENHYHLVVETGEGNLAKGMRQLNGVYTQTYNRRHRSTGHVFEGRYKAVLIQKESHFLEVCRYVVLNPVRAKAVREPKEWKWSSYRATSGVEKCHGCLSPEEILGRFAARKSVAQKKYREFVLTGIGEESIWKGLRGQSLLGEEEFIDKFVKHVRGYEKVEEIPRAQRYLSRPSLQKLFGSRVVEGLSRRDEAISEAVEKHGYSQKEVADHLDLHYSTISCIVNRR
jgi:REP element-mobilizing transposase RayT